jgi:hypothetical protein
VFKIVVEEGSLNASSASDLVGGILYVKLDGEVFPDDRWWDFPLIVLDWWQQAMSAEISGGAELEFMDGDAAIELEADGSSLLLTPRLNGRRWTAPVRVANSAVSAEIDRAIGVLVDACQRRSLPTPGFE